jgi:hypothetical protein
MIPIPPQGDLQIHSKYSPDVDQKTGLSPRQIIHEAKREGIKVISITDHLTSSPDLRAEIEYAKRQGVLLIPGMELDTHIWIKPEDVGLEGSNYLCYRVDLLAYFNPRLISGDGCFPKELSRFVKDINLERRKDCTEIIKELMNEGYFYSNAFDDLKQGRNYRVTRLGTLARRAVDIRYAPPDSVARFKKDRHLAKKHIREKFSDMRKQPFSPKDLATIVDDAKGRLSLAHMWRIEVGDYVDRRFIRTQEEVEKIIERTCVSDVEVFYPYNKTMDVTPEESLEMCKRARKIVEGYEDLGETAGGDFHGRKSNHGAETIGGDNSYLRARYTRKFCRRLGYSKKQLRALGIKI